MFKYNIGETKFGVGTNPKGCILATKDKQRNDLYENGQMLSRSLTVTSFMTKMLLEIWAQLRTKYLVSSTL